ncbi:hypothetical protein [Flavobacterium soyae]|uniref:Head domain of trimeric autotransporter adhesin n=1 Tax=Flavobacterium soyae TaxID=2903098 RepID=A0ABZ2UMB1_9FLAO
MCIDPLAEKYPYNSTYAFQENKMGMGVELEGLELASRNPVSGFGNYVKGKFDSAVSSIQTNTEKTAQAVSSAISSLGINQVDGYTLTGSKSGVTNSTGFFPEAKGAKSSANLDGDVILGLADAYAPDLGANKIMDGANIFSNLAQDPYVNKAISAVSDKISSSSSNSNGTTVTVQKGKYTATGTVGNTASTVNRKVQDTVVKSSDAAKVKAQNTKDSIKAVNQNNKINANTNFTD